ncbi:MAG: aminodeoxychorismate synthase component I [Legionellaceae bacterium]|nr:aminodeoxychorismate synthase component I [Legionellaceae bacterium]
MKTLIIDNYDSFTNNLYQIVAKINNQMPIVIKNDEIDFKDLSDLEFDNIIISPGPGHPEIISDFGICSRVILESTVPVLGVCLGHQGLACVYGGVVKHASQPMHGRISEVVHNNNSIFANIPNKFNGVRYHSLVIEEQTLPDCLEVIARSSDGTIMGVAHSDRPVWGLQYHPESIKTEYGQQILQNFMDLTKVGCGVKYQDQQEDLINIKSNSSTSKFKLLVKKLVNFYEPQRFFKSFQEINDDVVWLDSSLITPGFSRFSFMGCLDGPHSYKLEYNVNTKIVKQVKNGVTSFFNTSIFNYLESALNNITLEAEDLPFNFKCGFVGYFGYELYQDTLSQVCSHNSEHPDSQLLFLDRVVVFDNQEKECYLLSLRDDALNQNCELWFDEIEQHLICSQKNSSSALSSINECMKQEKSSYSRCKDDYIDDIKKSLQYITDGESYEICLTNRFYYADKVDPYKYYLSLRQINPAPYSAFLRFADMAICSSSVERFLSIDKNGNVETRPIKGTLQRGSTEYEDICLINQLREDEKFQSENLMIVDLLRHDLGGVCEVGSVYVDKLMDVETYSFLHQLVSTIRGKLSKDKTSIDCIKATFPGGSMTGAPKIRTVGIINELEKTARGVYSGAIGYISLDGALDLNIVIRTAVITPSKLSVGIGGAIIALSDPSDEYAETILKLQSHIKSLNMICDA